MEKDTKIAIIGQGYVGLPLAIAAAEAGFRTTGIDIDSNKVSNINRGISPVEDIPNIRLSGVLSKGNYSASCSFESVKDCKVVVICVPTPLDKNLEPDLKALKEAIISVSRNLQSETLLINESTSFPGTLREVVVPLVSKYYQGNINNIYFASAPERINPGDLKWNIKNTPRLLGGINEVSSAMAEDFYSEFCSNLIITETPEIAEAAKVLENTFRLVNISLIIELNQIFSKMGIDTNAVVDAASTKPYGFTPFRSGVGIGGHCIPVDPLYLTWWANKKGVKSNLVELASTVSRSMPRFVAKKAIEIANNPAKNILILGVAYKSGVSDTRETPVLKLVEELEQMGVNVAWHDPLVDEWQGSKGVEITWKCDVAILATNQREIDITSILESGIPILDCTNSYRRMKGVTSL